MRTIKYILLLSFVSLVSSCTSDFDEINKRPDAFNASELSAVYFLTNPQVELYAPNRYPYWRAHLIHADRFSGQVCFGFKESWWSDELGYTYSSGYTDASWDWMESYIAKLLPLLNITNTGGLLEDESLYAIGLILKSLYFQMYTDAFGQIPFTEAIIPEIVTPKYDGQDVIYKGILDDLETAIKKIGDGVQLESSVQNDLFYKGDLQKWKKLANTLRLRIALRAHGANGADFVNTTLISDILSKPLLTETGDNCFMPKDPAQSQWASAAYGDVWYNFGAGSDWTLSEVMIDYLKNYDDPRLSKYAKPAKADTIVYKQAEEEKLSEYKTRVNFIYSLLDRAGVEYNKFVISESSDSIIITSKEYYMGQPTRLNAKIKPYLVEALFSTPSETVIQKKGAGEIFPEIVMLTAEAYFLRAEAALKGLSSEDAQAMFSAGIVEAMLVWKVDETEIATYVANSSLAKLNGSLEENLEKVYIQRWLAAFTDGFEAWAIVRDSGYPSQLANGVSNFDFFGPGDTNGKYPQRMRYGSNAYSTNGNNVNLATGSQGPDVMSTKLWWAK